MRSQPKWVSAVTLTSNLPALAAVNASAMIVAPYADGSQPGRRLARAPAPSSPAPTSSPEPPIPGPLTLWGARMGHPRRRRRRLTKHSYPRLLAQSGGMPRSPSSPASRSGAPASPASQHRPVEDTAYNKTARPFAWTKSRSPSEPPQTTFRGPLIASTSVRWGGRTPVSACFKQLLVIGYFASPSRPRIAIFALRISAGKAGDT